MADDAASAPPTAQLAAASISSPPPSDLEPPTTRTRIRAILDAGESLAGQRVVVGGWVKTGRQQGKGEFAFLEVNDGSCQGNLQVMVDKDVYPLAHLTHTGTSVLVEGVLQKPPVEAKQRIELKVKTVIEVGEVDAAAYPLPKTKITLETLRDFVHLRARTNTV